jgi:hypothetical protein
MEILKYFILKCLTNYQYCKWIDNSLFASICDKQRVKLRGDLSRQRFFLRTIDSKFVYCRITKAEDKEDFRMNSSKTIVANSDREAVDFNKTEIPIEVDELIQEDSSK